METREKIEWCRFWWEEATDASLPRVLLIGDSIAESYSAAVRQALKGKAHVDLLATSKCIRDAGFANETAYALEGYGHAIVHFNNGLHGVHLTNEDYAAALREYVSLLRRLAPKAALVWASSTPKTTKDKGYPLDEQRNSQVVARNVAAASIMAAEGIAINDLYSAVVGKAELSAGDSVHYNAAGREFLGKVVAEFVARYCV